MFPISENSGAKNGPGGDSRAEVARFDDAKITLLYQKYGPMVYRRCRSMLRDDDRALDAMQDVFVQLVKNREQLSPDHPSSLLYRMATHICLNRWRSDSRKKEWSVPEFFMEEDVREDPARRTEARLLLEAIFATEDEAMRAMALMYHQEEMTLAEIGQVFDLSISGVRKRLLAFQTRAHQLNPDPERLLRDEDDHG